MGLEDQCNMCRYKELESGKERLNEEYLGLGGTGFKLQVNRIKHRDLIIICQNTNTVQRNGHISFQSFINELHISKSSCVERNL